jgi:hypothetical protein
LAPARTNVPPPFTLSAVAPPIALSSCAVPEFMLTLPMPLMA